MGVYKDLYDFIEEKEVMSPPNYSSITYSTWERHKNMCKRKQMQEKDETTLSMRNIKSKGRGEDMQAN